MVTIHLKPFFKK